MNKDLLQYFIIKYYRTEHTNHLLEIKSNILSMKITSTAPQEYPPFYGTEHFPSISWNLRWLLSFVVLSKPSDQPPYRLPEKYTFLHIRHLHYILTLHTFVPVINSTSLQIKQLWNTTCSYILELSTTCWNLRTVSWNSNPHLIRACHLSILTIWLSCMSINF